jgi:hypothetical protein
LRLIHPFPPRIESSSLENFQHPHQLSLYNEGDEVIDLKSLFAELRDSWNLPSPLYKPVFFQN